jgi:hypothetical protein
MEGLHNDILIEFDADSCRYYVIWQPPVAIGEGDSESEALEDLRQAVCWYIDDGVERKVRAAKKLTGREKGIKTDKIRI